MLGVCTSLGCPATCAQTCEKALSCDLDSERVSQIECVDMCQRQDALYEMWEDEEKQQAFLEHRRCILQSTCEDIADGSCYDDLLFIWE